MREGGYQNIEYGERGRKSEKWDKLEDLFETS